MSKDKELDKPYKLLGDKLRSLREKRKASLSEVSGAVEIDVETLDNIEKGSERPSEDILLLLISFFSSKDHEADYLWQLAGYNRQNNEQIGSATDTFAAQPAMMIMPIDARIVYTDSVHVMANNHGVVMNFLQNSEPKGQNIAVSKVGMSREHAINLIELLKQTLEHSKPKKLSNPDNK